MSTCTDPFCRFEADPDYGDMCTFHGSGRAWMRSALNREGIEQERAAAAYAHAIVDDLKPEDKLDPADIPAVYEAGLRKEN